MGMTITEKIIARHAGVESAAAGDLLVVDVDLACIDDVQFFIFAGRLHELGDKIADPGKTLVIADHYMTPSGLDEAKVMSGLGAFGRERGCPTLLRDGIKHPVFIERGLAIPGGILVATDSHTNTAGAVSCLAVSLGPTDVAATFATGKTWLRVPRTIRFEVEGKLAPGVSAMDVGLTLLGKYGRGRAIYRTIEWAGEALLALGLHGRMTLANLTTEFGAKNGIFEADELTRAYAEARGIAGAFVRSDPDAAYDAVYTHDGAAFEPVVAGPPNPANVHPVAAFRGTKVDQAYLGTCTHSTLEDLHDAATVLKGRRVHPRVQLLVVPATRNVYQQAMRDGTLEILFEAGATLTSPGCGSCAGSHEGTLDAGQVRISTQSRNFVGRSGHKDAQIYLASSATVAAAAVAGEIVHPREILEGNVTV